MKYITLVALCFLTVLTVCAQKRLVFTDTLNSHKPVIVKEHDNVRLLYVGYLGQIQTIYGKIEMINDSLIRFEDNWTVRTSDILGFRRFSKYRELLQSGTQIVTFVGLLVTINEVSTNTNLTGLERVGISFGAGIVASTINNLLFPTRIKYFMRNGWTVRVEEHR